MTDEMKLLESIRPEYVARDTPPPLDWAALQNASAGDTPGAHTGARHHRWAWLSAAAAVIVVVSAVQVLRHDDKPTQMTPSPPETTTSAPVPGPTSTARTPRLAELADIAATHQVTGNGEVHYVKFSVSMGLGQQGAAPEESRSEYWIAPDLSGLVEHEIAPTNGPPEGPFAAGAGIDVQSWCWLGDAATVLANARTDPDAAYGANGMMWLIQYCALNGPPSPTAQSALLGELSKLEGVIPMGETTDPLGRPGEGFMALVAVPGMKTFDQSTIILDPDTGQLLALIRAQVGSVDDTTIPPDSYSVVFEDSAMVPEVGTRPE